MYISHIPDHKRATSTWKSKKFTWKSPQGALKWLASMTKGWSMMLILNCAYLQNEGNLSTGEASWQEVRCAFAVEPDLSHSSLSEVCGTLFVLNLVISDQKYAIRLPTQACNFHFKPTHYCMSIKLMCCGGTSTHAEAGRWGPTRLTGNSWDAICNPQELIEHSWALTRAGRERKKEFGLGKTGELRDHVWHWSWATGPVRNP